MRIRTGLTPDAWRDDGPSSVGGKASGGVQVATVGFMTPIVSMGGTFMTNGSGTGWGHGLGGLSVTAPRGIKYAPDPVAKLLCGALMRGARRCARTPGHHWEHKDAISMELDAARRRTKRP
jgi:hypothetical protein